MAAAVLQKYYVHVFLIIFSCQTAFACYGTLLVSGITEDEKRIILQEHNRLRQIVATGRYPGQPAAENMREMVWDDELAARAQQWANNCQFRHDPQRTINRFTMGQNLAVIWSTAPLAANDGSFPSRIQSWFNEVQKYSFGDAWSPATGHYSQLVWGETSLVGCGFSEYKDATKYNKLYVCNYGPGGNVVGYNPYQQGKPSCATWGLRTSPHYQGLCATNAAPASGVTSNTIETYEYKQLSKNKQTTYSTQSPQPASSYSSSYSPTPQQASSILRATGAVSVVRDNTTASAIGSRKAYYGNSRPPYTGIYKNKFETYRPSAEESQKSVLKHTILRLSYDNDQNSNREQEPQEVQELTVEENDTKSAMDTGSYSTTERPVKRGWSLLTWRG